MIRADFLRLGLLSPLAALLGCKKALPVGVPAPMVATSGLVQTEPISSAWTYYNAFSNATVYVPNGTGQWVKIPDDAAC